MPRLMLAAPGGTLRGRANLVFSLRFDLLLTLTCALVVPLNVLWAIEGYQAQPVVTYSLVGIAICASASTVMLARFETYPGVNATAYVLPTVGVTFAIDLAVVSLLRLPYSAFLLSGGFLGTLAARYGIAALRARRRRNVYALVPGGRVGDLQLLPGLSSGVLVSRDLPAPGTTVVADLHHDHSPEWERFLADAAISGVIVCHHKQVWEAETGKVQIEHLSENSFGSLVPGHAYGKVKRIVDLALALVALPPVTIVILLVGVAIRWDSPGPAIIRQTRMGFRGRPFAMLKFRTMRGAPDTPGPATAGAANDDRRITRLGRVLRRTRLDELPQVFNIARGEMSWIGPRPEALALSAWYEQELPFYRYRHIVRPGLTGWAQVNQGHVTAIGDIDTKLQYDFYYIKNFSYWIDILIFFRTFRVVLTGFGAK